MIYPLILQRSCIARITRPCTVSIFAHFSSQTSLEDQMKQLNKQKKYREVLSLFDTEIAKHDQLLSSTTITQAIKACVQTNDYQRGIAIQKLIPARLQRDPYILSTLLHFYSECNQCMIVQY